MRCCCFIATPSIHHTPVSYIIYCKIVLRLKFRTIADTSTLSFNQIIFSALKTIYKHKIPLMTSSERISGSTLLKSRSSIVVSSSSLLGEGPATALPRDAIKASTKFLSIQTPFRDDDNAEHEHKDQTNIFVCYTKLGNF